MDDLNAPLGKSRTPKPAANKAKPKSAGQFKLVAALFCGVIALNVLSFINEQPATTTAMIELPKLEAETPIEVVELPAQTATQTAEPDVEVVYGSQDPNADQPDFDPDIMPQSQETITEVSPGGARIITVRDPTMVEIGQPLDQAHLPEPSALEESPQGPLPIRANDGRRPADIYARPWSSGGGKRIAIVIGGLGLSQTGTKRAIDDLPPEITLAFAPTGFSLDRWMKEARKKGHELLIQVPMEPFNYPEVNPGPNTLRLASSPETNLENLYWALGKTTNYTGIVNYLGARFISDKNAMKPILDELGKRGLIYFNDGSAGGSGNLGAEAQAAGAPYLASNIIIDSSNDPNAIRAKLKALEALANARGQAVGYGNALELTVETVAAWANEAKKNGFEIVGVAALAKDPERNR